MFWFRTSPVGAEVAFTDDTLDLRAQRAGLPAALGELQQACGVRFARLRQVHGDTVVSVDGPDGAESEGEPEADAVVTTTPGVGLMVRAADCVPVVLADPAAGVVGAAHAGRRGTALGVVPRLVEAMVERGASTATTTAWIGPHVCGSCYEVPEAMRAEIAGRVPETWARTRGGTPALDLGAGVRAQLARTGVAVVDAGGCTLEEARLPSHRRQGEAAGRLAGLVWLT